MKNIILTILSILSVAGGILFAGIAVLLFFTSDEKSIAGIFVLPALALLLAGTQLWTYRAKHSKKSAGK